MMKWCEPQYKYVVVNDWKSGIDAPFLFPRILTHNTVSNRNGNVISAGFCERGSDGKWKAWGESITLRLQSRIGDAAILDEFFPQRKEQQP
jgi:hypothetical protein